MSLKRRLSRPGLALSVLVHVTALSATLVAFSHSEKFDDLREAPPIATISSEDFNQIMKGQKSATAVRPEAVAKAEEVAPQAETQPNPPTPDKSQNEPPPPPPPPPPLPPVRQVEEPRPPAPTPPPPPTPVAVMPPPRPEEPAPETPAPVPTPPVRDVAVDPVPSQPKPPQKPVPPKPAPSKPLPPVVPHPVVAKLPEPRPQPKPRPVEKPKVDLLAKLMQETPTDSTPAPAPHPAPAKPHAPARTASESDTFDPNDISKLLNSKAQAQRPSTGRDTSHLASLGAPNANAAKMAPSMWAGLDGLMEDQYRSCWSYLGLNAGEKYIPQVRVLYGADGALEGEPVLINPPSNPALQSLADSAMRAVRRCNPLKIPPQYAPYYEQWKGRVLRFDPEEMAG